SACRRSEEEMRESRCSHAPTMKRNLGERHEERKACTQHTEPDDRLHLPGDTCDRSVGGYAGCKRPECYDINRHRAGHGDRGAAHHASTENTSSDYCSDGN